ncbi:SDR family NAD(P)-dependent oxidoreductase [Sphingomonas floccifaciens]|uniref:SDR family NAD(P)-dependent oxidoreductase n=1 Tax=Sphingomonas floccifaciens TaxID=1844115 RepID=A0ABW4NHG6_9SPHN
MTQPLHYANARALIVGGTSGVGMATARRLGQAGCRHIAIVGRNAERGRSAAEQLQSALPDAVIAFISANANDPAEADRVVGEAEAAIGPIDILVNSTSTGYLPDLFFRTAPQTIAGLLAELTHAPIYMSRAVIDGMRARGRGVIINLASDAAKVPTPGETIVGAAMAAIVMFSRTLALEAKRDGIRVHALTPSLIAGTPTAENVTRGGFSAKLFESAAAQAHLGVAEPDDIASTICFLVGPEAARMTGQVISINGGISVA